MTKASGLGSGFALVVWAATLAMDLATLWVIFATNFVAELRGHEQTDLDVVVLYAAMVALVAVTVSYASVGLLLSSRPGAARIGAILLAGGALFAATPFGYVVGGELLLFDKGNAIANAIFLAGPVSIGPGYTLVLPGLALAFPNGRLPSRRWRFPVGVMAAVIAMGSLLDFVRPGEIAGTPSQNPFGIDALPVGVTALAEPLISVGILGITVLGVAAVLVRRRTGDPLSRQQMKWFVAAVLLAGGPLPVGLIPGLGGPQWLLLAAVGLLLVPVSVWIAVTRHRLYDIDRIVSRTLAYGLLTAMLGGVYAATVIALQAVLAPLTTGSTLAITVSTLVVAALFAPLRERLRGVVDQRFNRAQYDHARTVERMAGRLAGLVHVEDLRDAFVWTVDEALQPAQTGVWLRGAAHPTTAGSGRSA